MVTVGIDPHKHCHVAVGVDDQARRVGRPLTVTGGAREVGKLLAWAREMAADAPLLWAIEGGPGLGRALADALLMAGEAVVWVPARLAAAQRRLHAARGAKSDTIDATAVARAAIAAPDLDRHRIDPVVRQLRLLIDTRQDLVRRRTALINRIKAVMQVHLDHHPGSLTTRTGAQKLIAHLHTVPLPAATRQALGEPVQEIIELNRRIASYDTQIAEQVTPLAPTLLQVPGIGPTCAATLLAEIGDITRFASSARLARWAGCAPIPVYSSNQPRHRLHRGGNRRANRVLHVAALVQARTHPPAQALTARHTPTKGKRGAQRVLKRHLIDVLYRAMTTDRATWTHHRIEHTPTT